MPMRPWFEDAKLGIFVHWGIYAVDGVQESWSFYDDIVPHDRYMSQLDRFTAARYDPRDWARLFARAGARYAVLTSRHHDGVALWDTAYGDLNVGRDLIGGYAGALREQGLKVGAVGAPAHLHTRAAEMFHVIDGALRVLVGEEITVLEAGDFLLVPPHTPHAFAAAPGATADVLFVFTPGAGRFDYLRLLGRVMRGEADPQEIKDSSERFDNHYVDSPVWREALAAGSA